MDVEHARTLLAEKRSEVEQMLGDAQSASAEDTDAAAEVGDGVGDSVDQAPPMEAEQVDEAVAASLREKLEAIERAEARVADGTYGTSVRSGAPIPDERLEADPTAELTVEEAAAGA